MSTLSPWPSPWLLRFLPDLPRAGSALDVACGNGRHLRCLRGHGLEVTGIDRDLGGVADLIDTQGVTLIDADLEIGAPWPVAGRVFDVVIVTNYLWRPLFPELIASVAPGGWLIYETFARGHERYGRPTNPDFLLEAEELLTVTAGHLVPRAYEQADCLDQPTPAAPPRRALVQRLAARRENFAMM